MTTLRRETEHAITNISAAARVPRPDAGVLRDAQHPANRSNRGRFIPLTREQLVKCLVDDPSLWRGPGTDTQALVTLATLVDAVLHTWYRGHTHSMGKEYAPVDPDWNIVHLANEDPKNVDVAPFLHELAFMADKANYEEVSEAQLRRLLMAKRQSGMRIKPVPREEYHTLRFFVRGVRSGAAFTKNLGLSSYEERAVAREDGGTAVFERVLVAVRYHREGQLYLKLFKHVPVGQLDVLLPNAQCSMSVVDKLIIGAVASAGVGVAAYRASANVYNMPELPYLVGNPALITGAVLGVLAFQSWAGYQRKRHEYNTSLFSLLWAANLDNNRGVIQRLAAQVEGEEFKEVLLAYVFLLASPLPLTERELAKRVDTWMRDRFGERIEFDVSDGLEKLQRLGLGRPVGGVVVGNGAWQAEPVERAIANMRVLHGQSVTEMPLMTFDDLESDRSTATDSEGDDDSGYDTMEEDERAAEAELWRNREWRQAPPGR